MIIHLPKNISHAYAQEFAEGIGALCLEQPEYFVLITNHTVKQLPESIASFALNHWVFNSDMQLSSRAYHADTYRVEVADTYIGGDQKNQLMIAGPCAIESREQIEQSCQMLKEQGIRVLRAGCYKPRTSPYTFRGLGEDGLKLLAEMREKYGLLIATEMRDATHADKVVEYADIVQVGAKAMYDHGLLTAAGQSGKPVILDPSHAMGYAYGIADLARACTAMGIDGLLIETHPQPNLAQSDAPQQLDHKQFAEMYASLQPIAQAVGKRLV